jgi:hypothetical protein
MYVNSKDFSSVQTVKTQIRRGFTTLYHSDVVNHCPACGHTQWHVGRAMAECAFCETALPIAATSSQPMKPLFFFRGSSTLASI